MDNPSERSSNQAWAAHLSANTLGLPEPKLREPAGRAGFGTVRRVQMDNPFNNLYELRP